MLPVSFIFLPLHPSRVLLSRFSPTEPPRAVRSHFFFYFFILLTHEFSIIVSFSGFDGRYLDKLSGNLFLTQLDKFFCGGSLFVKVLPFF